MLAWRLLAESRLPYLSLDVLKMGLTRGVPQFPIDPDAGAPHVAERLWPLVREMSRSLLFDGVAYVFEGELLPKHVATLRDEYPSQVHGCFLGYGDIAAKQKLGDIRAHAGHPNDWPQTYTDAMLMPIIRREIAFSQYLRAECLAYDLPYFDTSEKFEETLERVVAYVRTFYPMSTT